MKIFPLSEHFDSKENPMLSLRRVSYLLVSAVLMAIFMAPSLVNAQDATAAATCDPTFGSDAATVFTNISKTMSGSSLQAADFAKISVDIAKIRQEYEDMTTPPSGCETTRQQLAKVSALDEDVILLNLLA